MTRGVPHLTAVPRACLADWQTFTGDIGRLLLVSRNGGAISPSRQRAARALVAAAAIWAL
ncbi:DUF2478 domain-containing protein [Bradyrhizobium barranii subsp. apii]|uniref:DUF2478 domain-containing protein n=1 Tax=Bradyrhizobium barranii subsp. apii TaxID=2819348 RepID=A0A8U0FXK0_9BRAD|nr:DUF2478 domain-containing protein [Bradyrhizobium barranii]UPT91655.1 DUF2478 domain-containing protein [Bradyrhizobium barranii subsp. apii]